MADATKIQGKSITIGTQSTGEVLGWDGTNWVNVALGTGLQYDVGELSVDPTNLVSDGLEVTGGEILVKTGDGLMIDSTSGAVKVDPAADLTDLSTGAALSDVITSFNDLLQSLRDVKLMA